MTLARKIFLAAGILFFILSVLLTVFYFYLPAYLESEIIPKIAEDAGISEYELDIRSIGLFSADLGPVRIGPKQNAALSLRSVQIYYSPKELFQRKISSVVFSGIELHSEYRDGQLALRGLDLKAILANKRSSENQDPEKSAQPPLSFRRFVIRDAVFHTTWNARAFRVPFDIAISSENSDFTVFDAQAAFYPRGQKFFVTAGIDLTQKMLNLKFHGDRIELAGFADFIGQIESLKIRGITDIKGTANLQLSPFRVAAVDALLELHEGNLIYKGFELQSGNKKKQRFQVFLKATGNKWSVKASDIFVGAPIPVRLSGITGTVEFMETKWQTNGNLWASLETLKGSEIRSMPIEVKNSFDIPVSFAAAYWKEGNWRLDLNTHDKKPKIARFGFDRFEFSSKTPKITVSCSASGTGLAATYALSVAESRITSKSVDILLPKFVLKGKADIGKKMQKSVFKLQASDSTAALDIGNIQIGEVTINGKLRRNSEGILNVNGTTQFTDAALVAPQWKFKLSGASGTLPLIWPFAKTEKPGNIAIAAVKYQTLNLGAIDAELQQTASGVSFSGKLKSQLIPQLSAKFLVNSDFLGTNAPETRADFELFYPETGPEIDLGKLLPAGAGFTFEGKFLERGNLVIGKERMIAASESRLSNGKIRHRENKIEVEGVGMDLIISDLLKVRSAPGQKLRFDRAAIGGLNIENGEIVFQIESAGSLLIEKSHFRWCDGKVEAPAIRLRSDIEDYSLILYCDRLNLAKVLEQFGAASVEAGGELNGRIPIRYHNGQLSFHDGFLFTTPGETGKIRMMDTEILTAGILPDTPQYMQMELARKALEDYDYTWAKLNLTTEGEDVLLKMQLDGKPAKPLPFVYQKDMGGFVKVEADVQGSTFQGIRLDVNFRLPLNKIMQYKELIRMIQKSRE